MKPTHQNCECFLIRELWLKLLLAYGGRPLKIKEQCSVVVQPGEQVKKEMPLIVVVESGSNLLRLDWSDAFDFTSRGISALKSNVSALSIDGLAEATKSVVEEKISLLKTKYANVCFRIAGKVFVEQSVYSSTFIREAYLIQSTFYPIGNQAKSST